MFKSPSLIIRIAIGKLVGLVFGLAGFILAPWFLPEADLFFRWGILLWYPTLGAVIGVFGAFNFHPVLKLPLPWWFRAPFIGAWMNFVLVFFAYDTLRAFMLAIVDEASVFSSPFWFTLEGAFFGLITGYLATRYGGEGNATLEMS